VNSISSAIVLKVETMRYVFHLLLMSGLIMTMAAGVSGCRKEEQNRILSYEKGTYLGTPDRKLPEQIVSKLEQRSRLQSYY